MAEVELKNIIKRFDKTLVIDDCSLVIEDKEFLVLVGPSGCGKSTLLRIVAGLESPTDGEVSIDGKQVNDLAPKDRDIAMVFQSYALYPHMNVYKNMAFGLKMRGYSKQDIDRHVKDTAKILEIENLLERKPAQLSGGQRQRVAMGRAIVRKPAVFLFDEPLSNLDAKLRVQMRLEIKRLHERIRTTTIYVTHDQVEALTLADRIAIIEGGKIQQLASPGNVYDHPANRFVAEFIGSPPMNFIPATIREAQGNLIAEAGEFQLSLQEAVKDSALIDRKVDLGIRPEHFSLTSGADKDLSIEVVTDVIEPLGSSIVAVCKKGAQLISASLPSDASLSPKQKINLHLSADHIKLFDAETGRNLLIPKT